MKKKCIPESINHNEIFDPFASAIGGEYEVMEYYEIDLGLLLVPEKVVLRNYVRDRLRSTSPNDDQSLYVSLHLIGDDVVKGNVQNVLLSLLSLESVSKLTRIFFDEITKDSPTPLDEPEYELDSENFPKIRDLDSDQDEDEVPSLYELFHQVGDDLLKSSIEDRVIKEFDTKTYRTILLGFELGVDYAEGLHRDDLDRLITAKRLERVSKMKGEEGNFLIAEGIWRVHRDPVKAAKQLVVSLIEDSFHYETLLSLARYCYLAYRMHDQEHFKWNSIEFLKHALRQDPGISCLIENVGDQDFDRLLKSARKNEQKSKRRD